MSVNVISSCIPTEGAGHHLLTVTVNINLSIIGIEWDGPTRGHLQRVAQGQYIGQGLWLCDGLWVRMIGLPIILGIQIHKGN